MVYKYQVEVNINCHSVRVISPLGLIPYEPLQSFCKAPSDFSTELIYFQGL